uniref:Uncharacterized protein n=1 Tax=Anguilla anguilla TaxID=7936 RepID=A0A0E9QNR2_ANGAN
MLKFECKISPFQFVTFVKAETSNWERKYVMGIRIQALQFFLSIVQGSSVNYE